MVLVACFIAAGYHLDISVLFAYYLLCDSIFCLIIVIIIGRFVFPLNVQKDHFISDLIGLICMPVTTISIDAMFLATE